jgi:hypothetical protein
LVSLKKHIVESAYKTGKVGLTVCCPYASRFGYGNCSNDPIQWTWTDCGHRILIDGKGYCHCTSCGHSLFIYKLNLKCSSSNHGNDRISYKLKDLIFSINLATGAMLGLDQDDEDDYEALDFMKNMSLNIIK